MKNIVQKLIFVLIMVFSCYPIYGQAKKTKYTFKMDKVAAEFESELRQKKIDTILQAFYLFDNGRGEKATNIYIWTENGKNYIKVIRNAKNYGFKEFEVKDCPEFESVLEFYIKNIEDILRSIPKASMSISHNYGYYIKLKINQTEFKTFIRDERRTDFEHYRAKWINLIHEIAKPYINYK
jgi:hypothetical protein